MNSRPPLLGSLLPVTSALLLLVAGCTSPGTQSSAGSTSAKATAPAAKARTEGAFDDDAHALTAIESAVTAAGKDPVKLAAVERDLLAKVQDPASPPALVQEAAQHLAYILPANPPHDTLAVFEPMLSDPAKVDYARLALDRVPGASVDELYLAILAKANGRPRLALIESVGNRGITAAVPILASWVNDSDPAVALATTRAIGRIGGLPLFAALKTAKDSLAPAVLNARLAAVTKSQARSVIKIAGDIYRNPAAPTAPRATALRMLIDADPDQAAEEIYAALASNEPAFQAVAIAAISLPTVPVPASELADRLGSYAPSLQVPLIAALATRGHAAAIPGLLKVVDSNDAAVRVAALDALGRLPGTVEVAKRLVAIAAGKGDDAKAAAASLARLNGPGIETTIRVGAEAASPFQAVYIQLLAARNETEAIPFLLDLRESPSEAVRLEALDALRLIALSSDLPAIVAWAVGAPSKNEQNRAVRALITIILRDGAVETRAAPVLVALKSGNAAARQILLPILSRVAGQPALDTAAGLTRDADAAVAAAATAELARWPDAAALPLLVELAVATKTEAIRTAAVQGAARFLSQRTPAIAAKRSVQARSLLDLPLDPATKETLLNVISLGADQVALAAAKKALADPATAAVAQGAVEAITSNLAGPPAVTASVTPAEAALMGDGKADTFWQVPGNDPGMWIRADLHNTRPVRKITLEHGGRGWGYPGKFDVQVGDNPDQPAAAVAQGEGERNQTVVSLPAGTRGRYLWIRLTSHRDAPLAIAEITVE